MLIKESAIKGVFEIILEPINDSRGFFVRTYDNKIFRKFGLDKKWVQENHSFSKKRWTIRGIHFQYPPFAEAKLIRVIQGKVLFTVVDLRYKSPTFGKWLQMIISSRKKNIIFIPRGCAACTCTLTDNCQVLYKMDNYYAPKYYDNIKWNDPDLNIKWPIKKPVDISEKDAKAQSLKDFIKKNGGLKV